MGFQIDPEDLPPHIREALTQGLHQVMEDHGFHQALDEARRHQLVHWLEERNEEDLLIVRAILMMGEEPRSAHAFIAGLLTYILQDRFGYCAACGENHDKAAKDEMEEMSKDVPWADFISKLPDEFTAQLNEHHMELIPGEFPKVKCARCGMPYPNLADRMMKGPDDCPGCQDQARWGGGTPPNLTPDEPT